MEVLEEILRALDASCLGNVEMIRSKKTNILVLHPSSLSNTLSRPVQFRAGREPIKD